MELGARLAAARAERGWSLADAQRSTDIRLKYLEALERGDLDSLPGWAYARAFVRTYARALGLDADQLVAEFEEAAPPPAEEMEIEPIGLPPARRFPARRVAFGVVALGTVALVVWAATSSHSKKSPPTKASPPPRAVAPQPSPESPPPGAQVTTTTTQQASATLIVRATRGRCWLIVRADGSANGDVLYEGTLDAGESKTFSEPNLWIRFGAPSAVDVTRGGKSVSGVDGSSPIDVVA
ncbi:MAG TPA: helix-turn-helix domain-containing protein [Gaiellaceae bacterium]|nr:helix-turn-helix domain-containing protein [Gaiellaceae bacterium]